MPLRLAVTRPTTCSRRSAHGPGPTGAEALTNVAKHSRARQAAVTARVEAGTLQIEVRDDGIGGARTGGTGIVGLGDRLAAVGGRLRIESPVDGGTLVAAAIPITEPLGEPAQSNVS
jgi:nitrate/nitrite-specific signal transduction histidine kinase